MALVKPNWNDFTLIRPALSCLTKFCSYRIQPYIIPFLRITLMIAQEMIEEAFLPMRLANFEA